MLTYRLINDRHDLRDSVWQREQRAPRWFKSASELWHKDKAAFDAFWSETEVFGLFDDDRFVACVYIENIEPRHINVHVSVVAKVAEADLVRFFQSLTELKAREGVTVITGWMLQRNRGLRRVAAKAGYNSTGLVMVYGVDSRGRVMEWVQVRA